MRLHGAWFDVPGGALVHVSERTGEHPPEQHVALAVDDPDDVVRRLQAVGPFA